MTDATEAATTPNPGAASRRIVAYFFLSLDGVMEAPERWHLPYFNEEMGAAVGAGFASSDMLLMGGTLYREWSRYWPASQDEPIAGLMNGLPKYVVSNSLDRADWTNSTLIRRADAAAALRDLKARTGKDIAVSGSATLVRWLLAEGLLDELHLLVHPVVVGTGRRLFEPGMAPATLELVTARPFATGVVYQIYRPAAI
jgi:dihydrofolate reductase